MIWPFVLVAAVGVLVTGAIVVANRRNAARVEALRALATRLGWGYREQVPFETLPRLDRFELFRQGRAHKLTNILTSPSGDPRAVVFDYTYITGAGKSQQTHRQTVFYATSDALALPILSLRPQHFYHTIAAAFGYQDINLERHRTFSEMFLLRGEDEDAVRAAFNPEAIEFLEQRPKVCAAGVGRELLFWHSGRLPPADEVEVLMTEGFELARRLSGSPDRAIPGN